MERSNQSRRTRRDFLRACLALPATTWVLAACAGTTAGGVTPEASSPPQPSALPPTAVPPPPTAVPPSAVPPTEPAPTVAPTTQPAPTEAAPPQALAPTPACNDDDEITPAQTEGPYFTPNSPERVSLIEPGITGTRLVITGQVLTTGCQPVARALLDFWQADDNGAYDNVGYRLRGHQFADDAGRYSLETIVPALYPGRTRHIHVKVQAPDQPILTTQLYFPNEPSNATDSIFHPDLVMAVQDGDAGRQGAFDFVLQIG